MVKLQNELLRQPNNMNAITDLVIRIKNGYMAKKESIESPLSSYREEILKKLVKLGYIQGYQVRGDVIKSCEIGLIYKDGQPAMTDVKIYSKPGRRWYTKASKLKPVLGGMGYSFLSTPEGIMTNVEAKKKRVGGELLFDIW